MVFDHVFSILHLLLQILGLTGLDNMNYNLMSVSLVFIVLGGGRCHCQEGMWIYSLREREYLQSHRDKKRHNGQRREKKTQLFLLEATYGMTFSIFLFLTRKPHLCL